MDLGPNSAPQLNAVPLEFEQTTYQSISLHAGIAIHLNEVGDMLYRIALIIKLIEFGRLIVVGHVKSIKPIHIRLCIQVHLWDPTPNWR